MNSGDVTLIIGVTQSLVTLLSEFTAAQAAGNQADLDAVRDRMVAAANAMKPPGGEDAVVVL